MALNKKIVTKIREKTANEPFIKQQLPALLSRIEGGHYPKREIEKVIKEIKV